MEKALETDPFWWEAAPRPALPEAPLPAQVDVAIIGSGYTGLCAAIQTARGGRETLVFDAEASELSASDFEQTYRDHAV